MFRKNLAVLVLILVFGTSASFLLGNSAFADTVADQQKISDVVVRSLSFPGMPADANPHVAGIAVVGDYAIADWLYADGGGETVLKRQGEAWQRLGGGGGAMESSDVIALGVPENIAVQLIQQIQAQWPEENTHAAP